MTHCDLSPAASVTGPNGGYVTRYRITLEG